MRTACLAAVRRVLGPASGAPCSARRSDRGQMDRTTHSRRKPASACRSRLSQDGCAAHCAGAWARSVAVSSSSKSEPYRPDRTRFVHANCDKARGSPPTAVPARFLVACRGGHLDDFPWHYFVHGGPLRLPWPVAVLRTGRITPDRKPLGSLRAVQMPADRWSTLSVIADRSCCPKCRGRHPHLGRADHELRRASAAGLARRVEQLVPGHADGPGDSDASQQAATTAFKTSGTSLEIDTLSARVLPHVLKFSSRAACSGLARVQARRDLGGHRRRFDQAVGSGEEDRRSEEARVGCIHEPESAAELARLHGDTDGRAGGLRVKFRLRRLGRATARSQCADRVHARRATRGGARGRRPTAPRATLQRQSGMDSCHRGQRRRDIPALQ